MINLYFLKLFFKSQKDDKPSLTVFLSVENLDDGQSEVELQKRNLSLPTIDLDAERIERAKFKSTSANQLDNVNSFNVNSRYLNSTKRRPDDAYVKREQEANKIMHLDWSNKIKFWHQLPNKNHQHYHLLGRKFKSGDLLNGDLSIIEPNRRRNSWWFGEHRRKDSAIEIVSLKQRSINDSDQVQHFVVNNYSELDDGRKNGALNRQSTNKNDLNNNLHAEKAIYLDFDCDHNENCVFQVDDTEQDENGLKVSLFFGIHLIFLFFILFYFFGDYLRIFAVLR